eukprot:5205988-Prymnesium_polylepis.1
MVLPWGTPGRIQRPCDLLQTPNFREPAFVSTITKKGAREQAERKFSFGTSNLYTLSGLLDPTYFRARAWAGSGAAPAAHRLAGSAPRPAADPGS